MEKKITQNLAKPILSLSANERQQCFKHLGIEVIQGSGNLGAIAYRLIFKPKESEVTLIINYRKQKCSLIVDEKEHWFDQSTSLEELKLFLTN